MSRLSKITERNAPYSEDASRSIIVKRHVLLLEVLIALVLVALCAFPLLYPHIHILKEEKKALRDCQLECLVDRLFADITEKLYRNEIPWSDIEGKVTHNLQIPELTALQVQGKYHIEEKKQKQGKTPGETYHLLEVTMAFHPIASDAILKERSYLLFATRKLNIENR